MVLEQATERRKKRIENLVNSLPKSLVDELKTRDVSDFDPMTPENRKMHMEILENMSNIKICSCCKKESEKKLSKCSACLSVGYCNRECQKRDWHQHKVMCPMLKEMLICMQETRFVTKK